FMLVGKLDCGRHMDARLDEKVDYFLGNIDEVGDDRKGQFALVAEILRAGIVVDVFDKHRVESRFAPLELDMQPRGRRLEHEVNDSASDLDWHVVPCSVGGDGYHCCVAIETAQVAPACHPKNM